MRKRRVLSCVLSVFIICGIICGPISVSATYNTLDDLEIDPWGDLDSIQGFEPPTPELAPDDFEPVTMFPDMETFDLNGENYWIVTPSESAYLSFGYQISNSSYGEITYEPGSMQFDGGMEYFKFVSQTVTSLGWQDFGCMEDFTISMLTNRTFEPGEYVLTGEIFSYLYAYMGGLANAQKEIRIYPSKVDVFSGTKILKTYDLSNGTAAVDDSVVIDDTLTNIGYKFYYSSGFFGRETWSSVSKNLGIAMYCNDGFTLEVPPEEDPSIGLLEGIIEWLKAVRDSILDLPQNIANFILEGLQALFIPDQEELTELMDKYNVLFEERLGFIYQMFTFVVDSFTTWVETMKSAADYSFTFPGISFPYDGGMIEIVPEQEVSLDNAVMDVLRPVLGTIVSIVCVLAFTNTCFDLVIALMSGQSYLEFIGRRREELDE